MIRISALMLACLTAQSASAVTLALPGNAAQSAQIVDGPTTINLPSGGWNGEAVPTRAFDGRVTKTAWLLRGQISTPVQIADTLKAQLAAEGWTMVFSCAAEQCGGYDFRFASNTLPAPEMYVDLGNFQYVMAEGPDDVALSLMISRAGDRAWVQMTEVVPAETPGANVVTSTKSALGQVGPLAESLREMGRAVLDDLLFDSGSSQLRGDDADALGRVAAYLRDNPSRRFAIVGHTDATGGLAENIALSRARARSVRDVLIERYDIPADQLEAEGIGYLAPIDDNETADGRLANRRVEIVLTE